MRTGNFFSFLALAHLDITFLVSLGCCFRQVLSLQCSLTFDTYAWVEVKDGSILFCGPRGLVVKDANL